MINEYEIEFLRCCKKYGVQTEQSTQSRLILEDIDLDDELKASLSNTRAYVWLASNQKGEEQGVIRNQVFFSNVNSPVLKVEFSLNLMFEEVYQIWEAYEENRMPLEWIISNFEFELEPCSEDILIALWTLQNGKWEYILNYLEEDSYPFEFKKYLGRY